jgi:PAS domain-containing protein
MCWKIVALQCEINDGWELFSGEAPSDEEADEWGQRRLDWLSRNMPPGVQRVDMDGEIQFVSL